MTQTITDPKTLDAMEAAETKARTELRQAEAAVAITDALRALHVALASYPADIQGQQRHMATTIPTLRAELHEALRYELGHAELVTLADELADMTDRDDNLEEDDSGL